MKRYRGLFELYGDDPERADAALWGRVTERVSRRGFLQGAGYAALASALGASIPLGREMPGGLIPAAFAATDAPFEIPGKDPGLVVLNDRPLNAETPAHLLDDDVTPADRLFVRNNGLPPTRVDREAWRLEIAGESVERAITYSLADLKKFTAQRLRLQLECGGNGRSEFFPPATGNQWTTGAIGCPEWTGVRLRELLDASGVKPDAVYIGFYGKDTHLSGDPSKQPISRGVPLAKALQDETLVAWAMNGAPIPALHGDPLRLVCGGWPGSASGKWVSRIDVRDRVHDGAKMTGASYRVPCEAVVAGAKVDDADMCIIEAMPVKSLISQPRSGIVHHRAEGLTVSGHAWAGELAVARVDLSFDFGGSWQPATLDDAPNRLAWQRFRGDVRFPKPGYYEVWARATDTRGVSQPMVVPGWNPKGYLNNACHRIAVQVVA